MTNLSANSVKVWWRSPEVTAARERAQYDTGDGTLVDVFSNLIEILDERDETNAELPSVEGEWFSDLAESFVTTGKVSTIAPQKLSGRQYSQIMQLLDLGAEPERLTAVGFSEAEVVHATSQWLPWRTSAVTMARHGATAVEIRAAIPRAEVSWPRIDTCLRSHGFDYGPDTPMSPYQRRNAERAEMVMREYHKGGTCKEVAARLGVSVNTVEGTVASIRNLGRYPELSPLLERAA